MEVCLNLKQNQILDKQSMINAIKKNILHKMIIKYIKKRNIQLNKDNYKQLIIDYINTRLTDGSLPEPETEPVILDKQSMINAIKKNILHKMIIKYIKKRNIQLNKDNYKQLIIDYINTRLTDGSLPEPESEPES